MKKVLIIAFKIVTAVFTIAMLVTVWGMCDSTSRSRQTAQEICAFAQSGKTVDEIIAYAKTKNCKSVITSSGAESELSLIPQHGVNLRYHRCVVYYSGQKVLRSETRAYDPK